MFLARLPLANGVPSRALLRQLIFRHTSPTLAGVIADETPGRGTDRPELIGRCVNFNGTSAYAGSPQAFGTVQAVSFWMKANSVTGTKWGPVDLSATQRFRVIDGVISVVNVTGTIYIDGQQSTTVTTGWHHVLATFSSAISATGFIGLVNGQGFFGGLLSDVQFLPRAITAAEALAGYQDPENWLPDVARTAWYKCESQHPTLLLDSSGNNRHATCSGHIATVGNFFYEGNDVPGSYLNKVGHGLAYSKIGASNWDTIFYSSQSFTGDGYVEWTYTDAAIPAAISANLRGLNSSLNDGVGYATVQYALQQFAGTLKVWESGIERGASTPAANGDVFRIQRTGSTITYLKNGVVFYTSLVASSGALHYYEAAHSTARYLNLPLLNGSPVSLIVSGTGTLSSLVIPRNESNKTKAIFSQSLPYIGEAPRHAQLQNNNCGTFDGTDDYVLFSSIGSSTLLNRVKFRVMPKVTVTDASPEQCVIALNLTGTEGIRFGSWSASFAGEVIGWRAQSGHSSGHAVAPLQANTWHEIDLRWNATLGDYDLYIDGVKQGGRLTPGGTPTKFDFNNLRLGRTFNGTAVFGGSLCDVQFYDTSDTLISWLPFSEGKGTDIHDVVPGGRIGAALLIDETLYWGTKQPNFAYNSAKGSSYDAGKYIPARNDGSGLDAIGLPLTYAPSPGVWPLSEATLNSNPNNAPRRGTPGPTAFHPVTAPGSNPTFFRRRTKNSQLVGIDRFLQYSETLSGTRLTQAQTFTTEKAL